MFIITVCLLKGPINPPENHYAKSPSSFSFFIFQEITKQISKKPITKDNNKLERDQLVTGKDCRNRSRDTRTPLPSEGLSGSRAEVSPPTAGGDRAHLGIHTLFFMHIQRRHTRISVKCTWRCDVMSVWSNWSNSVHRILCQFGLE